MKQPTLARSSAIRVVPCLAAALPLLAVLAVPNTASAACINGNPVDCNPAGSTLNAAAVFVDPSPPAGYAQCAGFINTAADDVAWNWENNCIPYNTGEMFLRAYDMAGNIIAGARLFDGVGCPFGVTNLGYDTDTQEGAGLLGHAGICDSFASTTFGWHGADTSFCSCTAPDGLGSRTCDDIFTANSTNTAILYVGGNSTSHAYEAVYGAPGGKNTCSLNAGDQHEIMIGVYVPDPDSDGDGLTGSNDNCPLVPNPGQENADGDALGDACDPCVNDPGNDVDGDGVCAADDVCDDVPDPMQADADLDGLGDACDPCPGDVGNDPDADEICAAMDNCPEAYNPTQIDQDMDGIGAVCDVCPLDVENDADGDLLCGEADNCPAAANPGQEDDDMDGVGDACDACPADDDRLADADADGVCEADDNCPKAANPGQADADEDGQGDACDPCVDDPSNDADGDAVCGNVDNCPEDANADQADADDDGQGDACDDTNGSTGADDTAGDSGMPGSTGGGSESGPEPGSESGPIGEGSTGGGDDGSTSGLDVDDIELDGCACTSGTGGSGRAAWWLVAVAGLLRRRRRSAA